MAEFYDISDWQEKPHFQTGGTRNKVIVENPDTGELYYFKTSLKKIKIDYKYEFWSEILASEIGNELGFATLKYDIAWHKDEIGCLSQSMINTNKGKLSEGINYLRGYDPNYNPDDKKSHSQYTFSFIEKALDAYSLKNEMHHLVKTIIFDSLIGNRDRHQENWGFVVYAYFEKTVDKIRNIVLASKIFKFLIKYYYRKGEVSKKELDIILYAMKGVFSPIYDSGSSLGRELADNKIDEMLKDDTKMEEYINHDRCEIRWTDEKISHFELIKLIKEKTIYKNVVEYEIKRISEKFNKSNIEKIIEDVDKELPNKFIQYKLPDNRKKLIGKFVLLRLEKLKQIVK